MWRNVIELENKIKAERIELAKTYVINNGMNPRHMTEDDLFAIYSCLMVKLPTNKVITEVPKYITNIPNKNIFILTTSLSVIIIPHYRKTYNRQNAQNSRTKFG